MATWRACFETPNFLFEAFESTKNRAILALYCGWHTHSLETGADMGYLAKYSDDIETHKIHKGECYRDRDMDKPLVRLSPQ